MPAVPATAHVNAITAFTTTARRAPPWEDRGCAFPVLLAAALFGLTRFRDVLLAAAVRWRDPSAFERLGGAPAAFWRAELPEEARRAVVPDGFREGRAVVVRLAGFAPPALCAF
jgi:hypothetical protein